MCSRWGRLLLDYRAAWVLIIFGTGGTSLGAEGYVGRRCSREIGDYLMMSDDRRRLIE